MDVTPNLKQITRGRYRRCYLIEPTHEVGSASEIPTLNEER